MIDQNDLLRDSQRITQMDSLPGSVTNSKLFTNVIFNGVVSNGSFSINDSSSTTITVTTIASPNPDTIIAACPFQIALFQTTATSANLIPQVNATGWTIQGPFAMPFVTPAFVPATGTGIGNNGKNIVNKIIIHNGTGSTQTVIYYVGMRIISFAQAGK